MKNSTHGISTIALALVLAAIAAAPLLYFIKQQKNLSAAQNQIPGTIILLNGTSAAGKTSIMKALQKIYGDSYVFLLGDEFLKTYTVKHPMPKSMAENDYQHELLSALCTHAKQLSLEGKNVFVELVDFDDHYEHYCSILDCTQIVKILVYCPLDIMVDHIEQRNKVGEQEAHMISAFQQFLAIYKLQEFPNELIVDRIATNRMKYGLQMVAQEMNKLMKDAGVKEEDFETATNLFAKPFIEQYKLDTLKEIVLVPKHPWDLAVNTGIHSPEKIALIIAEYLKQ